MTDTHNMKCVECGRVGMILYDAMNDIYSCKCGSERIITIKED